MSETTVRNVLSKFLDHNERGIIIVWHGGEPCLAGKEFFQKALEIENELNHKKLIINNQIQTNGTLLNEDFVYFLKLTGFKVGVSFDGLPHIHNANRISRNGKGTYEGVLNGMRILKSKFGKFGTVMILTKKTLGFEKEIYCLFKDMGLNHIKINAYIPGGTGISYKDDLYLSPEEYAKSMISFYNLWISDPTKGVEIEPLNDIVEGMFTGENISCSYSGACVSKVLSIEPNGDVYPCGRISDISRFKMGNINNDSIEAILNSSIRYEIEMRSNKIKCRSTCKFFKICGGGCYYESYVHFGDVYHPTPYCMARKELFEYIHQDVRNRLGKS